jgi:hypothetical protein
MTKIIGAFCDYANAPETSINYAEDTLLGNTV